jgi:hypothetical protein
MAGWRSNQMPPQSFLKLINTRDRFMEKDIFGNINEKEISCLIPAV